MTWRKWPIGLAKFITTGERKRYLKFERATTQGDRDKRISNMNYQLAQSAILRQKVCGTETPFYCSFLYIYILKGWWKTQVWFIGSFT